MCSVVVRKPIWLRTRVEHILTSPPTSIESNSRIIVINNYGFICQICAVPNSDDSKVQRCSCDMRKLDDMISILQSGCLIPLSICLWIWIRVRCGIRWIFVNRNYYILRIFEDWRSHSKERDSYAWMFSTCELL